MKTAFFDIDTQIDFLYPAGALYVPHAESIVPAIAKLNQNAAANGIALVSTVDAHAEDDPEFAQWPPHCILGTLGQRKPQATLVPGQRIFEKTTTADFLTPALMSEVSADRYIIYGVVTEICVKAAADALLATGKPVELVTDAVMGLSERNAADFLAEFQRAGGRLTNVSTVTLAGGKV
jgi:nicotinamidase/pyrazinamidase